MSATTAVVILIFVVSIFSGFGGNKGYKEPPQPTFPVNQSQSRPIFPIEEPSPSFAGAGEDPRPAIQKFVSLYRQPEEAAHITDSIMRHSQTYNLNPKLVTALIRRESKFNPRALSSSGAMGLGQLLPATARGLDITDGFDIDQNAKGTVRYIKSLVDRFGGKISSAVAAYLEGPNAVARNGVTSEHARGYVQDILSIYWKI